MNFAKKNSNPFNFSLAPTIKPRHPARRLKRSRKHRYKKKSHVFIVRAVVLLDVISLTDNPIIRRRSLKKLIGN